ncbi:PAAR-like domain-containing protein [Candidatus Thiosymbion oneisti]|uniref:PAAR-like domain-containing protein n=1 Tax=Candidatus Thiosymbion oneisti TaxID=589554 RepID=UPI000A654FDC|nr:PAAR-like domain-containing protein [Candidatus Thiosymbion oneisti]
MANNVFANGREIACKAAEGKSVCAFPDVCMTPPETPATPAGVPVPYPNTGYAKDTTKGSKTVKISGKPVMLRDQSYFKTSTGNEAGSAAKKGVVSGVNRGKVYFVSWSMNVKIEGKNVVRHLDLTTHNHGSVPGNTGTWKYIDTSTEKRKCKRDKKRIDNKCKPTKKEGKRKRAKKVPNKEPGAWKDSYCKGLTLSPSSKKTPAEIEQELNELFDVEKQLKEALQDTKEAVLNELDEKLGGSFWKKLSRKIPYIGPILKVSDIVSVVDKLPDVPEFLAELEKDIENLKQLPKEIERIKERVKEEGYTLELLADAQAKVARFNPCLRARKCMLVPRTKSKQSKKWGDKNSGCCLGQTPHHLIADSWFKEAKDCPGYDAGEAPCVCVEGTHHSRGGTHQEFHDFIEGQTDKIKGKEISYRKAKEIALDSHNNVFGHCDRDCIEAQLDNYYKKACGDENFKVRAVGTKGGRPKGSKGDDRLR